MSLADDMAFALADAVLLGAGFAATYAGVACTVVATESQIPNLEDAPGEVRRRELDVAIAWATIPSPAKDAVLVIGSGPYAGTWYTTEVGNRDGAAVLIKVRRDATTDLRAAGVIRQP